MGVEGRSLFDVERIGDRVLWVMRGDRCLMLRFRRSGFVGDEGAIAVWCGKRRSGFVGDEGAIPLRF
jgi:hypothetical protein